MPLVAETSQNQRQEVQLACFKVGAQSYALDIMRIKEIIRYQELTPVPKAPKFIQGVINLRGQVIPVCDLRSRFDHAVCQDSREQRIIVCLLEGKMIGLLVDEVTEVALFLRHEVSPTPEYLKNGDDFFHGVARRDNALTMVIDLGKMLSSGERKALREMDEPNVPAQAP
jgi:purine-binding chemotaxis protein CheW